MSQLPPAFLDEIKARVPLSEVVGQKLRIIRAGREYKACCPFHKEKTPSFTINDDKGFYHCFGCGVHGDVVSFLMEHDNLPFMEAVEILAARAGMQMPAPDPKAAQKAEQAKNLYDIMEMACALYQRALNGASARAARDYLAGRGLDAATIEQFRLGYAPVDSSALFQDLRREGAKESDLLLLGLIRQPEDGRSAYAFFRNRILFPVTDRKGRVVAFGARLLEGDGPKYVNSPESPIFNKGHLLYNMAAAREALREDQPLILSEGYMDVIALSRAGFAASVAPLGTAVTESQIEGLWRLAREEAGSGLKCPILCFDGDEAGRRAALRAMDRALPLLAAGRSLSFAFLPQGEDPDSLLSSGGRQAMQSCLDARISLSDLLWQSHLQGRNLAQPEARAALKKDLLRMVGRIEDADLQRYYRDDIYARLGKLYAANRQANRGGRFANQGANRGRDSHSGSTTAPPRIIPAEVKRARVLLAAMINYPQLFEGLGELLARLDMPSHILSGLRNELIRILESQDDLDENGIYTHLSRAGFEHELEQILSPATYLQGRFAAPGQALEEVARHWQDWAEDYEMAMVGVDLERMKSLLAEEMTDDNLIRLRALAEGARSQRDDHDSE